MVTCIFIDIDGQLSEVDVDLDPNTLTGGYRPFLGNKPTFVGKTIVCENPLTELIWVMGDGPNPLNNFKFPKEFAEEQIRGPVIVTKLNDQCEPENLSMNEFINTSNF